MSDEITKKLITEAIRETFGPAAELERINRKKLLNPVEAAKLYGIALGTLNKRRSQGLPPRYRKIGGSVYYTHADMQEFIEESTIRVRTA